MAAASLGSRKIETKRECERKFGACACMCVRVHVCVWEWGCVHKCVRGQLGLKILCHCGCVRVSKCFCTSGCVRVRDILCVCVCTVMRVCQHVNVGEWVCDCVGVFMPLRKCTGKCVFVRT